MRQRWKQRRPFAAPRGPTEPRQLASGGRVGPGSASLNGSPCGRWRYLLASLGGQAAVGGTESATTARTSQPSGRQDHQPKDGPRHPAVGPFPLDERMATVRAGLMLWPCRLARPGTGPSAWPAASLLEPPVPGRKSKWLQAHPLVTRYCHLHERGLLL